LANARTAFYIRSEQIKSPMAGNIAAFNSKESMQNHNNKWKGTELRWDDLIRQKQLMLSE
jgi:copper chaperone NosL